MKRLISVLIAGTLLAGCGGTRNQLLPVAQYSNDARTHVIVPHGTVKVATTITVPGTTKSVGVSVNGAAAQVFNTISSAKGCKAVSGGVNCTFSVNAPAGTDTWVLVFHSATNGGGKVLKKGTAVLVIAGGSPKIVFGPSVSNNKDSGTGSLRWAVGLANPGNTITFFLPSGATITLAGVITVGTSLSIAGPGSSKLAISGNNTQQIFSIKAGVTSTISGLTLKEGHAAVAHQPGGAIGNLGTLTLASDAIIGNTSVVTTLRHAPIHRSEQPRVRMHPNCVGSNEYGGAIYNNGILTVSGSTFSGNVVNDVCGAHGYGGAIYNDSNGVLTVTGGTFTNNAAENGGAIYNAASYGSASFTGVTFSGNKGCTAANGCPLSGCSGNGCTSYPLGYGGAIYDADGPGINVASSKFENNVVGGDPGTSNSSSFGDGGALYLNATAATITGSTFSGNEAGGGKTNCTTGYGGAIFENQSAPLELDNDTFTGNKAGGDYLGNGGAVYNHAQLDRGSGNTFDSNQVFAPGPNNGTGSGTGSCGGGPTNKGQAAGGAVYGGFGIAMSNSTFKNNVATSNYDSWGAAIYIDSPSTLSNDTFTSNNDVATGAGAVATYAGGAIYASDQLKLSGSTFTGNLANAGGASPVEAYGPALYAGSNLSSTGNTFTSNKASAGGNARIYGGAVWTDSNFASNGDTFKSNTANGSGNASAYGGALYIGSHFSVVNATFGSNTASAPAADGGALYIDSSGTVANSTFSGNKATAPPSGFGEGGAIDDEGGATFNSITVSGNSTTGAGGGLFMDASDTVNNSTFTSNTVTGAPQGSNDYGGGGIDNENGTSTIANSTISGNTVTTSKDDNKESGGGGIFAYSITTLTGDTISGNKVLLGSTGSGSGISNGGGGVYEGQSEIIVMTNTTITGNSSAIDGGGFENRSTAAPLDVINVTLYQNTANATTGNGGNIYNTGTIYLANTIAAGGSAHAGKDVNNPGALDGGGYNIFQTALVGNAITGSTTGDLIANPKLLALAGNGGPTQTNADTSTSPGKQHIPFSFSNCGNAPVDVDQRNFKRGAGGKCDVGAYEFNGVASALKMHAEPIHAAPRHQRRHAQARPVKPPHAR